MLQRLHNRLARGSSPDGTEDGFTLIELMVVVLIIAILIAIAIPTFLGARQKAQDRAAQSNLRNALTAVKTAYVDSQDYTVDTKATPIAYQGIEPSLKWATGTPAKATGEIDVNAVSADTIILAAYSASGECLYIQDITGAASGAAKAGTQYAKAAPVSGACDPTASGLTFTPAW